MYELGECFKINYDEIKPNQNSVIEGKKYRFTILTERLIRIQYNENGVFHDAPTLIVKNRNFPKPEFSIKQDKNYLEILTSYMRILYKKEKKITNNNDFKVEIINTDKFWYYNHVEAKNYDAPIVIENGKIKNTKSLYSLDGFVSIDDSKTNIISEDGTIKENDIDGIDIYLFVYLNDFDKCLKDYYKLTGFPLLIPRFALGNWWSRNNEYDDLSLKKLVDNFNKYNIPISVILLDKDWHIRTYKNKEHLKTGFTFNKELFKAPYEMISYLHSQGIRLGLSINPTEGFYEIDEYFEQAKKYLNTDEFGVIPYNALDPKWVDVYLKLYIHPLDALGADFYWLDVYNDVKNMHLLKHYQLYDMKRNYRRRPMLLSYNSFYSQHNYSILYSGKTKVSWESLKQIPKFNCSATNIGINYVAHDIGGYFKGIEDNELYTRYVQLGVFSPIFKFGADCGKYYKREPWRWSVKTLGIVTDFLQLRHKLLPYLYSEAYKYSKDGVPLIKPLYYVAKEMYDDLLYSDEYYFGSQMFVCPITKKKDYIMNRVVHRFYLPEGIWYDFFTGQKYPGNNNYVTFYKDQNYPVFAKAGSIIPLGYNDNLNDTNPPKNLEIHFFPGISNQYLLYEDDGISSLYEKGFYLLTQIDYNYMPSNYTVIIRSIEGKSGIVPEYRNYKLIFRNVKKANEVIVYEDREQIECKYYVDGPDFVVEVENIKSIGQLTVNCKGKDIEFDPTRLINDDIAGILDDLQIETLLKEKIDSIIFSDLPIKKKRIEIRKLSRKGLENKFIKLFLRLLEYISTV